MREIQYNKTSDLPNGVSMFTEKPVYGKSVIGFSVLVKHRGVFVTRKFRCRANDDVEKVKQFAINYRLEYEACVERGEEFNNLLCSDWRSKL